MPWMFEFGPCRRFIAIHPCTVRCTLGSTEIGLCKCLCLHAVFSHSSNCSWLHAIFSHSLIAPVMVPSDADSRRDVSNISQPMDWADVFVGASLLMWLLLGVGGVAVGLLRWRWRSSWPMSAEPRDRAGTAAAVATAKGRDLIRTSASRHRHGW